MVRVHGLATACLAAACAPAFGQGTLVLADHLAAAEAIYRVGGAVTGNAGQQTDNIGIDFTPIEDRSFSGAGFSGRGYSDLGVRYSPPSPHIGGQFFSAVLDACTSAQVFTSRIGPHTEEWAYAIASGHFEFTIDQAHFWSWAGGWQGESHSTGSFNRVNGELAFTDVVTGFSYVAQTRVSINASGDWVETFGFSGFIGAGHYSVRWLHESLVDGGATPFGFFPTAVGGAPLISCINSTFTLEPVPTPGTTGALGLGLAALSRRRRR